MKKLIKKIVCMLLICASLVGVTSCNNNQTDNPTGNEQTSGETTYPLMDYFENKVYAMKYAYNDITCGTYDNSKFTAIGNTTMSNIINKGVYDFGKDYGGLTFTAKTGVEVESVTFTIVADKDCIITLGFYGGYIKENGNFDYAQHFAGYDNGNVTLTNGQKGIYLKTGEPFTMTLTSYRAEKSITESTKALDFGKITSDFNKNPAYKRFMIAFNPVRFDSEEQSNPNNLISNKPYQVEELEGLGLGIRICNINFVCKKIN